MIDTTRGDEEFELAAASASAGGPRRRGRPDPRFKSSVAEQLDPLRGCPAAVVPEGHLAREVWALVGLLDTSELEAGYSSLGRHGYHPRRKLAVWVYASLVGIHHASKVAVAMKTDHAFLFLSGGHQFSASTLKNFRREHSTFMASAVEQTVRIAVDRGLIDPEQLAVDSARIEADASTKSVRTLKRSKKRLKELETTDTSEMSPEERDAHDAKVAKHQEAVERCQAEGRTSHSVTDPHAGLLKFPNGASLPGHRVTAVACGTELRFVVSVLIHAVPNDFGQLEEAVRDARQALIDAGMPVVAGAPPMQVAADPGYLSQADLQFASDNRDWVDVLIHEPRAPTRHATPGGAALFGRDAFHVHEDGSATCPAGRKMQGPHKQGRADGARRLWKGVGCETCPLRARCTKAKQRSFTQDPVGERLHTEMKERMSKPDAKARYNKRIATIEPVFGYIEDAMNFRRSSSRKTETVKAELLLKLLAHNLMRLAAAERRRAADGASPHFFCACFSGVWTSDGARPLAAWLPWRAPRAPGTGDESGFDGRIGTCEAASDRPAPPKSLFLSSL